MQRRRLQQAAGREDRVPGDHTGGRGGWREGLWSRLATVLMSNGQSQTSARLRYAQRALARWRADLGTPSWAAADLRRTPHWELFLPVTVPANQRTSTYRPAAVHQAPPHCGRHPLPTIRGTSTGGSCFMHLPASGFWRDEKTPARRTWRFHAAAPGARRGSGAGRRRRCPTEPVHRRWRLLRLPFTTCRGAADHLGGPSWVRPRSPSSNRAPAFMGSAR